MMKYLFGSNCAGNEEQELREQRRFLKAELPDSMAEELDRRDEELIEARKKAELPKLLKILEWVFLVPGGLCGAGVLRASVSPAEGYHNAPWAYWIAGIGLAVGGVLALVDRVLRRRSDENEVVRAARKTKDEYERSADSWLNIPNGARKADILIFGYREKGGRMKVQGPALNGEMRIYRSKDELCVTDGTEVFAIPINSVTGLRLVPGGLAFLGWNKGDKPDQEKYKKAGLTLQLGEPSGLKFCCALEWTDSGETWQLLFPAYELSEFEKLTGKHGPTLPEVKIKPAKGSVEELMRRYDGKVHPRFYWTVPRDENASFWFSPLSDESFKAEHPKLYVLLTCIGLFLLFLPMCAFLFAAIILLPDSNSPWLLLGMVGGFAAGIGLFNIVAAWLEQYLGHWVTILCLVLGGAMMAASWLLLAA